MPEPRPNGQRIGLLIGLLVIVGVATAAAHWPVLSVQALSLDDQQFLSDNPLVRNPSWASTGRFLGEVLTPSTVQGYYLPLSMISLMLDYGMGGRPDDLRVFHRTSLLLHVANTALIVLLLYGLFGQPIPAALVGLLFGVHPLTVEPIAWVGERKTLLAAFFALGCLLCHIRYAGGRHMRWFLASLAAYVLACMAKPTAAPLPVMLILLDYWPMRRFTVRSLMEKLPFLAAAGVSGLITLVSHNRTAGIIMPAEFGPGRIPLVICYLIMFYMVKIVWPANLTSIYTLPKPVLVSNPAFLFGLAGTLLLLILIVVALRRTKAPLVGGLFFLAAIFPTLGVVPYSWVVASDKYVYLPAVGVLLVLTAGLCRAWTHQWLNPFPARVGLATAVLLVCLLEAHGVQEYLPRWRDTLTHAQYLLASAPESPAAHNHLGQVLAEEGRYPEAIARFRDAIRLLPGYPEAQYNLGAALWLRGELDEAIEQLRPALRANPNNAHGHYALGSALQSKGKLAEAETCFRQTLKLRPSHVAAHNDLGSVLLANGKVDEAIEQFRQALQIDPQYADAHSNLGTVLAREGKLDESISRFRLALAAKPNHAEARHNLGQALELQGKLDDAIEAYRQAIQAKPDYAEAHNARGVALTKSGDLRQALIHFTDALRLRPDWLVPLNAAAWILATHPDPAIRRPTVAVRMAERAAELTSRRSAGVLDTLAAAYASADQFDQAVTTGEIALGLAESRKSAELAADIKMRLDLYRRGRPFLETPKPPASSQFE